jgi:hypothetical protein
VNNVFCRHAAGGGENGLARGKTADLSYNAFTFLQNRRPTCPVDRPIDSAPAEQRGISGVNDSLGRLFSDIRRSIEFNFLAVSESEPGCEI